MTTSEIIKLDYREVENRNIIQRVLCKIKPLSKYSGEEVPIAALEKLLFKICNKYHYSVKGIYADCYASDKGIIWRMQMHKLTDFESNISIYGMSIYETLAKSVILLYSKTRKVR